MVFSASAMKRGNSNASSSSATAAPTSAAVVPIPLYSTSSQFKNWRYSKSGLSKIRKELNLQAVERVQAMVEEERTQQTIAPLASTSTLPSSFITSPSAETASPSVAPSPSEIQYLTVQDELSLVMYYLSGIAQICQGFKFPEMVEATAVTYLKRFYLRNTCMDYHPKNVMLTSIFLATKTENYSLSIDRFSSMVKTTSEEVLSLEFLVSQSLRFEYKVHHAHLAGYGLSLDLQTSHSSAADVLSTYAKAKDHIRSSRLTDLEFIYSPSQIALACFRMIDPTMVDAWLSKKSAKSHPHHLLSSTKQESEAEIDKERKESEAMEKEQKDLRHTLEIIAEVIREVEKNGVDRAAVTEVDRRLSWAHNPEKDPNSALFKKRKLEASEELVKQKAAKAAKRATESNIMDNNIFL